MADKILAFLLGGVMGSALTLAGRKDREQQDRDGLPRGNRAREASASNSGAEQRERRPFWQERHGANTTVHVNVPLELACTGGSLYVLLGRRAQSHSGKMQDLQEYVEVTIPRGARGGDVLRRMPNKGDQRSGAPGEAVFLMEEALHPIFQRVGQDLHYCETVSFLELFPICLDRSRQLHHPGGEALIVSILDLYRRMVLEGYGVPGRGDEPAGDLHLHFELEMPDFLQRCDNQGRLLNLWTERLEGLSRYRDPTARIQELHRLYQAELEHLLGMAESQEEREEIMAAMQSSAEGPVFRQSSWPL